MNDWIKIAITAIASVLASSGFWTLMAKRMDKKDMKTKLLIGLAHDRIIELGMKYLERGYVTQDEYENLYEYLYKPYEALGGNGSAKKIIQEVQKLPTRKVDIYYASKENK